MPLGKYLSIFTRFCITVSVIKPPSRSNPTAAEPTSSAFITSATKGLFKVNLPIDPVSKLVVLIKLGSSFTPLNGSLTIKFSSAPKGKIWYLSLFLNSSSFVSILKLFFSLKTENIHLRSDFLILL